VITLYAEPHQQDRPVFDLHIPTPDGRLSWHFVVGYIQRWFIARKQSPIQVVTPDRKSN